MVYFAYICGRYTCHCLHVTKSQKYTHLSHFQLHLYYKVAVGFREGVDNFVHEQFQLDLGRFLRLSYRFLLYRFGTQPGWHSAISPRHDTPTQLSHLAMVPQYGNQPWLTNTLICCHLLHRLGELLDAPRHLVRVSRWWWLPQIRDYQSGKLRGDWMGEIMRSIGWWKKFPANQLRWS